MFTTRAGKAAILGFIGFVVGAGWMEFHERIAKRGDPPGWIVDRELYQPAVLLAYCGLVVFSVATIFGVTRWVLSKWRDR